MSHIMSLLNTIRRKCFVNAPMAKACDLRGKTYVVTGASEGSLGFATARTLLNWGATVIATKRSQSSKLKIALLEAAEACDSHVKQNIQTQLHCFDVDLCDSESVKAFCDTIHQDFEVDVLINNAGIHLDLMSKWTEPKRSDDGYEIQWRTNFLGTSQLTLGLLHALEKAASKHGDARIVNVVSMLHDKGLNTDFFDEPRPYNSWNAYGQSKLGLVHITKAIAEKYQGKGISSYCLHPGAVFTNVANKGLSGNPLIEAVRNFFAPVEAFFLLTPEEGAQTQIHLATAEKTLLKSGKYYRNMSLAPHSPEADDDATSQRLWEDVQAWAAQKL